MTGGCHPARRARLPPALRRPPPRRPGPAFARPGLRPAHDDLAGRPRGPYDHAEVEPDGEPEPDPVAEPHAAADPGRRHPQRRLDPGRGGRASPAPPDRGHGGRPGGRAAAVGPFRRGPHLPGTGRGRHPTLHARLPGRGPAGGGACPQQPALLHRLADGVGADQPFTTPAWTFKESVGMAERPRGGSIVVPYLENRITYSYDRASNRYLRATSSEKLQKDAGTDRAIAPANVVVLFMGVAPLRDDGPSSTNEKKNRLEIDYIGQGRALVFRDGALVDATWSKADDASPTLLLYASGTLKGTPVALVRGQIVIQVVPTSTQVTWKLGRPASVLERAQ